MNKGWGVKDGDGGRGDQEGTGAHSRMSLADGAMQPGSPGNFPVAARCSVASILWLLVWFSLSQTAAGPLGTVSRRDLHAPQRLSEMGGLPWQTGRQVGGQASGQAQQRKGRKAGSQSLDAGSGGHGSKPGKPKVCQLGLRRCDDGRAEHQIVQLQGETQGRDS